MLLVLSLSKHYFITINSKAMNTNIKQHNDPNNGGGCCGGGITDWGCC